jgi:hypothetical protein
VGDARHPGLLQTEEYARAVISAARRFLPAEFSEPLVIDAEIVADLVSCCPATSASGNAGRADSGKLLLHR